jgi:hypothetical protein
MSTRTISFLSNSNNKGEAKGAKIDRMFLCGPIPLVWIREACALRGRAIDTGLAIWFLRYLTKCQPVVLNQRTLNLFCINRHAAYRGLRRLEKAGLVSVEREKGSCARVSLRKISPNYLKGIREVGYEQA